MKLVTLFIILSFFQLSAVESYAQATKLNISLSNATLEDVILAIEKQTEFVFFYNNEEINMDGRFTINTKNKTIDQVLSEVLHNYSYRIENKKIILTPKVAQKGRIITGVVTDVLGEPLIGVTILIKGEGRGAVSDLNGKFSIEAEPTDILQFSSIGYVSQSIKPDNKLNLNVVLAEDTETLDEVVVIGYGTVRKTDLTGAVGSIKGGDIKAQGVSNITTTLQGRMPGVSIESGGGSPGSGARVLIRGVGTFGNAAPLYLVDGVPVGDISNINASDIESMNILKDASAAAIYGSRAANGVVLITTKSGSQGIPRVQFDATFGLQNVNKKLDVLNAQEWATVSNAAHDAAGLARLDIAKNPSGLGVGTDWQDAVYRTAPVQQYQLSVSGGTDVVKYSISGGYNNQKGIVETTGYSRYNVRLKTEVTKGRIKIGETFMAINEDWGNKISGGWGSRADAVGASAIMIPAFEIYDNEAIGGYAGAFGPVVNIGNPVAMLNLQKKTTTGVNLINNTFAELTILPMLKYKFNVGYTRSFSKDYSYTHRYDVGTLFTNPTNTLSETKNEKSTLLLENTLSFDKRFGKHNLQLLAGYTYQTYNYGYWSMANKDLPDGIYVLDAAKGIPTVGGNSNKNVLVSMLGRAIYSFDDRYLLTVTFRRDGSSRFASSYKYGNFPSVAVGWNVYKEAFFNRAGLDKVFSTLKLRGSYGVLGNQEIGDYLYSASIANNINYVLGSDQHKWVGAIQRDFATPDIRWETTRTFNVGLDASFLNNSLSFTMDWFDKSTHDILLNVPIPLSAGANSNPIVNAGTINNKGLEIGLNYNGNAGKFKYTVFGSASHVKNKVIELGTGTQQIFGGEPMLHAAQTTVAQAGGEVGEFYLRKMIGIFQSDEEVQAYSKDGKLIQPNAKAGDIKYLDANGDGTISDLDKVNCGSPFPKIEYGFGMNGSWNNFDFSVYFQGVAGNKIYNGMRHELEGMNLEQNYSKATLNAWTSENHSTTMPRAVINDPNYNSYTSSRYLENGSYLRLKTLQVGYAIPEMLLQKIKMQNLRVYISSDNLFTITKYTGFNPDLGGSGNILNRGVDFSRGSYPLAKTISFGIQLSL